MNRHTHNASQRGTSHSHARRLGVIAGSVIALSLVLAGCAASSPDSTSPIPATSPTTIEVRFGEVTQVPDGADILVLDIDQITPQLVTAAHEHGAQVYAYFSAGTAEQWRADFTQFPQSALAGAMDEWDGEFWLNPSDPAVLEIMRARIDAAAALGVDGVDLDNVDIYDNAEDAGMTVTLETSAHYYTQLATYAHERGLGVSLKNALDLIPAVGQMADIAINEQCGEYAECDAYILLLDAGIPVVSLEYTSEGYDADHPEGMQVQLRDENLTDSPLESRGP